MKKARVLWSTFFILVCAIGVTYAALVVPTEIQQPGTQQQEISNLESPDKCDNCHGGYNASVEPAHNWRGSMMANAGRDPIFWATVAVAEQDFDGAGDLCIRCHSTAGWLAGRSTPTDGSGLTVADSNGVDCDFCHKATNPDNSDPILKGIMNPPFVANDRGNPPIGYYGSGMASIWGGSEKLGPYSDAEPNHQFIPSNFHRSVDFCGTCHDVSNPAVGDLAHNNGVQDTADPVVASGELGSAVVAKAAFNNFPYVYGTVERTFSEYKAGKISQTLIADYLNLPSDLKGGVLEAIYNAAQLTGTGGNYQDGTPRYFSCQSCHMRPVTGPGCNKQGVPIRTDLPLHDMTGGNYWMPDAIQYLDGQNKLRLGGGLTEAQIAALEAGKNRAKEQLNLAASLSVENNTLKIVNHTGHKLISGYPEGRRMWLNIKWYNENNILLREDGKYGPIGKTFPDPDNPSTFIEVKSILDVHEPNTKIYQAHYGMTQEWAQQLIGLGYASTLPLSFDRIAETVGMTLGDLAAEAPGTFHETFHFVLNNMIIKDNRIPPYHMSYPEARKRNALPVPASQYGNPVSSGVYNYWDVVNLNPPDGAKSATIDLLYQPTSYEYQLFLKKANSLPEGAFLAEEGENMFAAWLKTNMAEPYIMTSTTWQDASGGDTEPSATITSPSSNVTIIEGESVNFQGNVTEGNAPLTYVWDFGDDGTSDSNVEDPGDVTFQTPGVYTVTFTVIDNDGDSTDDTVIVTVNSETLDTDGDGVTDSQDNCPNTSNSDQTDNDNDGIGNVCDDDDDNDGMPDAWENQYGLNPFVNDASGDLDGDGWSNILEYQRGTDPSNVSLYPVKALPWIPLLLGDN